MISSSPQQRQPTLDMVRGMAILMVVAFHLDLPTGIAAVDWVRPVVRAGWAGVDLFFVLSGFLVGRMVLREASMTGGVAIGRFFGRRVVRLWPALYVYLAVLLLAGGGAAMVMPVVLHVQNYVDTAPSHLWSLAVEEHFYLAAAFALPWLVRRGEAAVLAALLAAIIVPAFVRIEALGHGVALHAVQWQTPYRIDALATGVLLAAIQLYRPALFAATARCRRRCGALALVGFAWLVAEEGHPFRYSVGFSIAAFAAACVIMAFYDARVPTLLAWPARALSGLGTIAYSLYIWHASIARIVEAILSKIGNPALALICTYAATIGWSTLMYALVERTALRWRDMSGPVTSPRWREPSISTKAIANRYQ